MCERKASDTAVQDCSDGGQEPTVSASEASSRWLVGGGEMAKVIKAKDWSQTPLGPIESWPQSLRTTVSLAQASNSPISLAWGPGHVQIYNDGYWPICGAKHPTAMGQDFRECWASAFPVIGEAYATAWSGKSAYLEEMRMFLDRNGFLEETWFTFSFSPITDETGGVGGLFHPVTEMTSQMLWERRVRTLRDLASRAGKARTAEEAFVLSAEALAESDLDLPFVLFYLVDAEGMHAQRVGLTGLPPETSVSPDLVDLESRVDEVWKIGEVVRTGQAQEIGDVARRVSGMTVGPYPEAPRTALAMPIMQPGSERPVAVMVAAVSPRLMMTEPYRGFYDLVAATVSTALANAAYEEARRKAELLAEIDRAKTEFFSNVSHEFRTPITLILGPLEDELAEGADPLPTIRRERLETAHRNGLRLLKLVNSLLDFSRMEAGRTRAVFEAVDLAAATSDLAGVFRDTFEKAGLTLTIQCPRLPEDVYVDPEMWEKIVLNLLSNAFKHTFVGGVAVGLEWRGDHVALSVADTGIGIRAEELPRLFERFHRVQSARSRTFEGTGIGLALVRELAGLHGGSVRVDSQEGKGSTFTVTIKSGRAHLPANAIDAERTDRPQPSHVSGYVEEAARWLRNAPGGLADGALPGPDRARVDPVTSGAGAGTGSARPRIVWADDNADMRDYVYRLLADAYDVHAVSDGEAALAAVRQEHPDLVLTDVMMPGLDGFGLLRALRNDPSTQTIPVILLSARAGEESSVEGLDAGADDYLVKPFSARELLTRVRTHMRLTRLRKKWADELVQVNKELEAFSYSVSHDLQAPLRHISGFVDLLRDHAAGALDPVGERYLQRIGDSATKMRRLIEGLLTYARLGRTQMRFTSVPLDRLVESVVRDLQPDSKDRRIDWRIGPLPEVQGDLEMLRQVLVNLLSNAVKYTRTRPQTVIEIAEVGGDQDEAVIAVRDNGVGFDPRYAHKLFGVFQRLHRADEFEGTGIGLANVQRILARHGGRAWGKGRVDQGATFHVALPRARKSTSRAKTPDRLAASATLPHVG